MRGSAHGGRRRTVPSGDALTVPGEPVHTLPVSTSDPCTTAGGMLSPRDLSSTPQQNLESQSQASSVAPETTPRRTSRRPPTSTPTSRSDPSPVVVAVGTGSLAVAVGTGSLVVAVDERLGAAPGTASAVLPTAVAAAPVTRAIPHTAPAALAARVLVFMISSLRTRRALCGPRHSGRTGRRRVRRQPPRHIWSPPRCLSCRNPKANHRTVIHV